jgi:hypothetical protein
MKDSLKTDFNILCDITMFSSLCSLQERSKVILRQGISITFTIVICRADYLKVKNNVNGLILWTFYISVIRQRKYYAVHAIQQTINFTLTCDIITDVFEFVTSVFVSFDELLLIPYTYLQMTRGNKLMMCSINTIKIS